MFLNKYKNKRKLGRGAYGEVYLVQDEKGTSYALKIMPVKVIESEPHLRQYLDGQIQCMKSMNSPYIIKLYEVDQDKNSIYLLLQYCDGGDLINYQAKLKDRVFTIDKASEVLSQVIIGLQNLHHEGYLHRDIKSQNVLFKNQNGKSIFKLADFGFSKKKKDIGGTILGTDQYMSPQIFSGNDSATYGFEVDMWAFGVLFYFMLNKEFPFKLNSHWQPQKKQIQLKKLAKDFSYKAAVKISEKQLIGNCTDDLQDLFKQMFNINGDDRITFSEIREHPIFAKHFPVVKEASKILYDGKKLKPRQNIKKSEIKKIPQNINTIDQQENAAPKSTIFHPKDKNFPTQKYILIRKKDQIDYLRDNAYEFIQIGDFIGIHESLMLSYNLLKYYLILLNNFKLSLSTIELNKQFPGLKWNEFVMTKQFKNLQKEVEEDYINSQSRFEQIFDQCQGFLKEICEINSKFKAAFYRKIETNAFLDKFKESYRKSTIYVFGKIKQIIINKSNKKGNKFNYILSMLAISHVFNSIFSDLQNLGTIFQDYLEDKKKTVQKIDYSQLREWMSRSKENILNKITKNIIKIYFTG